MQVALPTALNMHEIYRFLGYNGVETPDAQTIAQITTVCETLVRTARPRVTSAEYPGASLAELLQGDDIAAHLEGCMSCVLIGVTLGASVDAMLRSEAVTDITRAVLCDAASSVLVEQIAGQAEDALRQTISAQGKFLTARFSPGYGDFPIDVQNEVVRLLDAPRKIGLTATETHILTPRKSITALCGVSDHPVTGRLAGCSTCALRNTCTIRKEGRTCAV